MALASIKTPGSIGIMSSYPSFRLIVAFSFVACPLFCLLKGLVLFCYRVHVLLSCDPILHLVVYHALSTIRQELSPIL